MGNQMIPISRIHHRNYKLNNLYILLPKVREKIPGISNPIYLEYVIKSFSCSDNVSSNHSSNSQGEGRLRSTFYEHLSIPFKH